MDSATGQATIQQSSHISPNYSYIFQFEESFEYQKKREWMQEHWHEAFYYVAVYMLLVFGGQAYMSSREPFKLRRVLTLWNIVLASFSIVGTIRTLPEMFHVFHNFGFYHTVCNPSYIEVTRVSGFWTWMFTLSKVPELGDTIFIVLRKQNLIFLHWYHHITVLLFTWYSYGQHISPARWYICMNYLVHSIMYSYYAARALGFRVPKQLAMIITSSQIIQMVVGCYVTYYGYAKAQQGVFCQIPEGTAKLGLIMYGSYFVLFANFFVNSYTKQPVSKGSRISSSSSSSCIESKAKAKTH
ncbi:elongation of very long chain fatty acids protein 6-like [Panonychus citri]|uniref:elongation of very long chain fatty acids protein 6-like n=1 Tax=Panonychus citri TaxID=50023 RepID=UPI002307107E|nr:elongation of very long chain fatty acids protein 6-like [Panonychus citri]